MCPGRRLPPRDKVVRDHRIGLWAELLNLDRHHRSVARTMTILFPPPSMLAFRVRGRASLELELIALRYQVSVVRGPRRGRRRLWSVDWLQCMWLYRIRPQILDGIVLVT